MKDLERAKDTVKNKLPILQRVRLLDWRVSATGQIFAPRQLLQHCSITFALEISAVPEEASGCSIKALPAWSWHRAYMDVLTATCQASYRILNKAHNCRMLFIRKSLANMTSIQFLITQFCRLRNRDQGIAPTERRGSVGVTPSWPLT